MIGSCYNNGVLKKMSQKSYDFLKLRDFWDEMGMVNVVPLNFHGMSPF